METIEVENIVLGAGVIGLAIGAEMSRRGHEVFVIEKESSIGSGTSSRNSEVIHSGIYYPETSFRRRFCVEGRALLYAYCEERRVKYRKCGKLVVATSGAETKKLEAIAKQAERNGVTEVFAIDSEKAKAMEPALNAVAALHVRDTGILDSHGFMECLRRDIESGGGAVLCRHEFIKGRCGDGSFELRLKTPDGPLRVKTRRLMIAAGLWSHAVAGKLDGYLAPGVPPITFAKGSYFSYAGLPVFTRLIYPIPVEGGLGTHLTLDLAGRMRFGPDVEWLEAASPDDLDYGVDPARAESFYDSIRRYWPGLKDGTLVPDYSGVRPKLSRSGEPAVDFLIQTPQDHGIAGLVAHFGIESPGLTSSLAIARHVVERVM